VLAAADRQISLTDPDPDPDPDRARGSGVVAYMQSAIDTANDLIVATR
jgi:hypothetical protein